jgi:hypothetical protein
MPLPPKTVIDPPAVERYAGGLYSAASFPELDAETMQRMFGGEGVTFLAETCAQPQGWAITCPDDVARVDKEFTLEFPEMGGSPFVEYLGVQCGLVGRTLEEYSTIVRRALDLCEQRAVEHTFWTGDMGNDPHLADNTAPDAAVVLNPGLTAVPLLEGISRLEEALGDNYCGVGVLHAPRTIAPYASNLLQAIGTPKQLTTVLGTRWAFGAGYSVNTGPTGVEAPDGEAWIYGTAGVQIYRSDMWLQPDVLEQAFRTRTNFVELLAERAILITMDCPVKFAVRVNLECSC